MSTRLVSQLFPGLVAICAGALPAVAQPAGKDGAQIPDFSTHKLWVLMSGTMFLHAPDDPGPGPIVQEGKPFKVDQVPYRANTSNPILKPWAKKLMDVNNDRVRAGDIPFYTTSRCWPGGVPGLLLFPGEPVHFRPDPEGSLDHVAARCPGPPGLSGCSAQHECETFRVRGIEWAITRMPIRWLSIRSDWTTAFPSTGFARHIRSNCMLSSVFD